MRDFMSTILIMQSIMTDDCVLDAVTEIDKKTRLMTAGFRRNYKKIICFVVAFRHLVAGEGVFVVRRSGRHLVAGEGDSVVRRSGRHLVAGAERGGGLSTCAISLFAPR